MDEAFAPGKDDIRALRERAEFHAKWSVGLGVIGLVLLLPLVLEPLATPAVAIAVLALTLASLDARGGRHRRAHRRFGVVLFFGVLAHVAWLPRMLDEGEPDVLLFVTLVGFMIVNIASMATVWADHESTLAMETELERARVRDQLQQGRSVGRSHGPPGPLTREELARLAEESTGTGTPRAVDWRGTPPQVNVDDERHPKH